MAACTDLQPLNKANKNLLSFHVRALQPHQYECECQSKKGNSPTKQKAPKFECLLVSSDENADADADDDEIAEEIEDVGLKDVSNYPDHDPQSIMGCAFQQRELDQIDSKRKLSYSDKQLQMLNAAYGTLLSENFAKQNAGSNPWGVRLLDRHAEMMAHRTKKSNC